MSIHIGAEQGQIAETVLLPGDPLRAKFIADTFLDDVICYNTIRGMLGFTGSHNGKKVSVQGSGMGIPSISIYVNELLASYGVKNVIRVGSCGSLQKNVKVRDIILASGSSTNSSVNHHRFNGCDYAPVADFSLLMDAYFSAAAKNIEVKVGQVFSSDEFYQDNSDWYKKFAEYGVLAVEMETSALYTLASKYGAKALSILTVSDSLITGEETTSGEREKTFTEMVEIALQIA
ncbi:MAG: purine-nucleoside phosphorylase [Spirochaetes bacterium]|nr:purine-nucleoside phosphorylase [Spirochaetota bacterium]